MPKVSKRKLKEDMLLQIHRRLVNTLKKAGSAGDMSAVLENLLTETEEIMLAKRLSIIFLLNENASMYFIHKTLGVSKNTVSYMKERFLEDEYKAILVLLGKKQQKEEMWKYLEIIIHGGMPARGKDRWNMLRNK